MFRIFKHGTLLHAAAHVISSQLPGTSYWIDARRQLGNTVCNSYECFTRPRLHATRLNSRLQAYGLAQCEHGSDDACLVLNIPNEVQWG
jgi:hypothetical protein